MICILARRICNFGSTYSLSPVEEAIRNLAKRSASGQRTKQLGVYRSWGFERSLR